jgi:GNAT superfamily N-acetyltransferase
MWKNINTIVNFIKNSTSSNLLITAGSGSVIYNILMAYILKDNPTREEHDALIDLTFSVWDDASIPSILRITHGPFTGTSAAEMEAQISNDKERAWKSHSQDPASHKPFVVHVPTGEIVGFIAWKIYASTPFPKIHSRIQLTWWPEGDKEGRECAEEIVNQCFYPRASWMNRPMAGKSFHDSNLDLYFFSSSDARLSTAMDDTTIRPDHQRKGVGGLLVNWGVQKADALGIECFVEATDAGRSLYKKFGFQALLKVLVDAENGTEQRHEMIQRLLPHALEYWAMWRPKGGALKKDAPQTLWQTIAEHAG